MNIILKITITIIIFLIIGMLIYYVSFERQLQCVIIELPQKEYVATLLASNKTPSNAYIRIEGNLTGKCNVKLIHPQSSSLVSNSFSFDKGKIDTVLSHVDWYSDSIIINVTSADNTRGHLKICARIN